MDQLTTTSNPTNIREIPRGRVSMSLVLRDGVRHVALTRFDLSDVSLAPDCRLILSARAGFSSQRLELGTVTAWDKTEKPLSELDPKARARLRILITAPGDPAIIAAVENLKLIDGSQAESLLPMEPADLGELVWRLVLDEADGPVLQYNQNVFQSAVGAENFVPFSAMVLPEALRQALMTIAADPSVLNYSEHPLFEWGSWIDALGAERPDDEDAEDSEAQREWADGVVERFCGQNKFAARLKEYLEKVSGND